MNHRGLSDKESWLERLARDGARARLVELDEERSRILELFPELGEPSEPPRKKYERTKPTAKAKAPAVVFDAGSKPEEPPARTRRTFTEADKKPVLADIKRGMYLADLAVKHQLSDSTISRWAQAANLKIAPIPKDELARRYSAAKRRQQGSPVPGLSAGKNGQRKQHTPEERERALGMIKAGKRPAEVARAMDIHPHTIHTWVARHGKRAGKAKPARKAAAAADESSPREQRDRVRKFWEPEVKAEAVAMIKAGAYLIDVQRKFSVPSISMVTRWCESAGVSPSRMDKRERGKRLAHFGVLGASGGQLSIAARKIRPAVDADKKAEVIRRVAAGESPTKVARELEVKASTARGWFAQSKGTKAGVSVKNGIRSISTVTRDAAIARMKAGERPGAVAKDLGLKPSTVRTWAMGEGLSFPHGVPAGSNGVRHTEAN